MFRTRKRKEEILANPFVHVELSTPDPEKSKAFYSRLFQWQLQDLPNTAVPGGTYTMIRVGETRMGGAEGGMMKQREGAPSGWLAYVLVEDIHASTRQAQALGAAIMKDVMEVPGTGWLSIIRDPAGAMLGMWQPKQMKK